MQSIFPFVDLFLGKDKTEQASEGLHSNKGHLGNVHFVLLCVPPSRLDQNSSSVLNLKMPEFAPVSTKVQIPAQRPCSVRLPGLHSLKTTGSSSGRGMGVQRPGLRPEGGSRYVTSVGAARQQLRAKAQVELKNEEAKRTQRQNDRTTRTATWALRE